MFGQDRKQLRATFYQVWRKIERSQSLTPLEAVIARAIRLHPEYHPLLSADNADTLDRDYRPEHGETNPFLHMGMHIALQEQVGTDRPAGIEGIYRKLLAHLDGDAHAVEHRMMECLAEMIWQGQRDGTAPDEQAYLAALTRLLPG